MGRCRMTDPGAGAGGEGIVNVVEVGAALICDRRDELIRAVVLVSVCRVFAAG